MPIPLFELLKLTDPEITPSETKLHLAGWNGKEHPLDVYLAGSFEEWQRWQSRRNFQRPAVLSLIQYHTANRWLFVGLFDSCGSESRNDIFYYDLKERSGSRPFRGRVVVNFTRPGRNSYLDADKWAPSLLLSQLLPEPYTIGEFPGYRAVDITKQTLDSIIRLVPPSWRTALSSVAGVYLISDTRSGKLYVGSATGEGGIWQRWSDYSASGHGGNALLRQLLREEGGNRATDFRYSILEIADIHESEDAVRDRESHWKNVLLSRDHGLNAN